MTLPGGRKGLTAKMLRDGVRAGARVDTPLGEVAAERLAVGDAVLLAGGGIGIVKWIGRTDTLPAIAIPAGTLDGRLPRRPLRGGRDQPILVAPDLLVPAHLLFAPAGDSEGGPYLQISLNDGACLLAEGAALASADGPADVVPEPDDRRPPLTTAGPGLAAARRAIGARSPLADPATRTAHLAAALAAIDSLSPS